MRLVAIRGWVSLCEQVVALLCAFMPEGTNQTRLIDQVDAQLNKVIGPGFVRRLRGQAGMFEVQRMRKAFVDAQWLTEFDGHLATYRASLSGEVGDEA